MNKSRQVMLLAAGVLFAAYVAVRLSGIISVLDLRDFTTYYAAAKAFVAGEDPYDLNVLSAFAGKDHRYAFFYPKYSLIFFTPFTLFEYQTGALVFIALKALALLALVYIWVKFFLPDLFSILLLCVFLVTAYHETVLRDFVVGNVSIFEQIPLWIAFVCFLRGKFVWYGVLIVFSALFKPMIGVFLLLPLVYRRDATTIFSLLSGLIFLILYYAGTYFGQSELLVRMSNLQWERGHLNPSMFAVIKDVLQYAGVETHKLISYSYVLLSIYGLFLSLGTFLIFRKTGAWRNRGIYLLACIFLYVLLMPRFKDYSYILLIVPSLLVIKDMVRVQAIQWFAVLTVCVHVAAYQSLFAAGLSFALLLAGLSRSVSSFTMFKPQLPDTAVQ